MITKKQITAKILKLFRHPIESIQNCIKGTIRTIPTPIPELTNPMANPKLSLKLLCTCTREGPQPHMLTEIAVKTPKYKNKSNGVSTKLTRYKLKLMQIPPDMTSRPELILSHKALETGLVNP